MLPGLVRFVEEPLSIIIFLCLQTAVHSLISDEFLDGN
jgi:hypothetical protein